MKVKIVAVLLRKEASGKIVLGQVIENPELSSKAGVPVYGPYLRRLLSVKEVAKVHSISLNKASDLRRNKPLECLADFPGQEPLAQSFRQAA